MNQTPAPNWYPDPKDPTLMRWWDGTTWTDHTNAIQGEVATHVPPDDSNMKKPLTKRAWFWAIIAVVVLSGVGLGIWFTGQITTIVNNDRPTTSSPTPSTQTTATSGLDNGDFVVGTDIAPGVYRAEIETGFISLCVISQEDDAGGTLEARASNEGSLIFTVENIVGSHVIISGCTNIGLAYDKLRKNPSTITNGFWLVGDELPAGTYQGTIDPHSAIVLGLVTQFDAHGEVIHSDGDTQGEMIFEVKDVPGSVVDFTGFSSIVPV
jgi:hypothetical protein